MPIQTPRWARVLAVALLMAASASPLAQAQNAASRGTTQTPQLARLEARIAQMERLAAIYEPLLAALGKAECKDGQFIIGFDEEGGAICRY
ncbi:hypothetical protein [Amorphus sp. MBR-141]